MKIENGFNLLTRLEQIASPADVKIDLKESNASFGNTLRQAIKDVNNLQNEAGNAVEKMVAGENIDLHEVMIAVEKARTSFDLLMEVRNKAVETYREIMRMQV